MKTDKQASASEKKRMKAQKLTKIGAPVGDNPPEDSELKQRIASWVKMHL